MCACKGARHVQRFVGTSTSVVAFSMNFLFGHVPMVKGSRAWTFESRRLLHLAFKILGAMARTDLFSLPLVWAGARIDVASFNHESKYT